ncbi:MFS transporter [Brevibacillus agri]|nr:MULTISPECIES: MFS transporter [Brevibacillus]MDN4092256.1 MFS transporter [Brevibacillus agri]MED3497254.1 MFS transporter [Brevibacillus agri]
MAKRQKSWKRTGQRREGRRIRVLPNVFVNCFLGHNCENEVKPQMDAKKVLVLLGVTILLGTFAQNLFMPILPAMQKAFATSEYWINLTISLFTVMLAVMQIVYGPLVDRFGRKKVLIPALVLYALASVGCYLADSIASLLVFRAIQGAGFAAIPIVAATMIGDLFAGNGRANAMGTYQMMLAVGPAIGPLLGGWIGGVGGHSAVFAFLAVTAVLLLIGNGLLLPETKNSQTAARSFHLRAYCDIFRQPTGAAVILLGFAQMFTYYCFLLFIPVELTHRYHLSSERIGLLFLLTSVVFMISSKLAARVQKRWGSRKALVWTAGMHAVATFLFMAAADASLVLLVVTSALFALALGIGMPVHTTLLSEVFEQERATAIGVYNLIRYMGMAAGPVAGAAMYGAGGTWLEFGAAGLLLVLAVLFAAKNAGGLRLGKSA